MGHKKRHRPPPKIAEDAVHTKEKALRHFGHQSGMYSEYELYVSVFPNRIEYYLDLDPTWQHTPRTITQSWEDFLTGGIPPLGQWELPETEQQEMRTFIEEQLARKGGP